eukprot:Sspe_Gene.83536::Locus_54800_Transcript_1_2_Confidence_0.667_Length_1833::g.83536::m.83536/K03929/pnbA; para-nitrobenzyl esterase
MAVVALLLLSSVLYLHMGRWLAVALLNSLFLAAAADRRNVTLRNGVVSGVVSNTFSEFKGIPYASPPVGDLRWRPPRPAQPWHPAVLDASAFRHNCIQPPNSAMGWPQPESTLSEDCLYLNVYAPPVLPKKPSPVMVWLHGGGYTGGGGNETRLNGTYVVALLKEYVVVTVNYRLGPLGFLAADALRDRDPRNGTGNYGILDQRMALQWVQENIAAFGGDPRRVMIAGQSAGADSVAQHLVRRDSFGLFHAAIMESGAFYMGNGSTVAEREEVYAKLLKGSGCSTVQCLLALSAPAVLNLTGTANLGPTIDGVDLVEPPPELASRGHLAPVPVVVGSVSEDIVPHRITCNQQTCSRSDFTTWAAEQWGMTPSTAERFADLYSDEPAITPGSKWYWAQRHAGSDNWAWCPARRMARWVTANNHAAYTYYWQYAPMGPSGVYPNLAHHACEIPFVFHVLAETPEQEAEDHGMYHIAKEEVQFSANIVRAWGSFAADLNPQLPNTTWTPYGSESRPTILIGQDQSFTAAPKLRDAKCDFWDDFFYGRIR